MGCDAIQSAAVGGLKLFHVVVTTLSLVRSDTMLLQHCHDVEDERDITTLWQHCHNIEKLHNSMTLPQCCYNIENDIVSQHSHNVQAMLCGHCMNVGAQY